MTVLPVAISLPDHTRVELVGELVTAYLAVTPALDEDGRFTGHFVVTHLPSGAKIGTRGMCIAHARRLAKLLAEMPADWSRAFDDLTADPDVSTAARARYEATVGDCLFLSFCAAAS